MIAPNASVPLTLVSGWGAPVSMIKAWATSLAPDVSCFSLDDSLLAGADSLDDAAERLLSQTHGRCLLVGWSLGGQVAMAAAARRPDRVIGVLTVASTPCFVARPDWPCGMGDADFAGFEQALERNMCRQWKRFLLLQIRGDRDESAARRALQPWLDDGPLASEGLLRRSLSWLAESDQRLAWQSLAVPSRHLFGETDSLVQTDVASRLKGLGLDVRTMAGLPHWPWGRDAEWVCHQIEEFARDCGFS